MFRRIAARRNLQCLIKAAQHNHTSGVFSISHVAATPAWLHAVSRWDALQAAKGGVSGGPVFTALYSANSNPDKKQDKQEDTEETKAADEQQRDPQYAQAVAAISELKGRTTVETAEYADEPPVLGHIVRSLAISAADTLTNWVLSRLFSDWNRNEFVQGCLDAYYMVHKLCSERDWDDLRDMVSPKLFETYKEVSTMYQQQDLTYEMELEDAGPRGPAATLAGLRVMPERLLDRYFTTSRDASQEAEQPQNDASQAANPFSQDAFTMEKPWLIVLVAFSWPMRTKVTHMKNGSVVSDILDRRTQVWQFGAGPVKRTVKETMNDVDWLVLDIQK